MTDSVIEQPIRPHSTHPPVGPFRCAHLGTISMPPVWVVKREDKKLHANWETYKTRFLEGQFP